MKAQSICVVIPTYKRAALLDHALTGLENQTNKDFDVLVIVKPCGDETGKVIKNHEGSLRLTQIMQTTGGFLDALNLGVENAMSEIIVFLDDDAIPFPNLIQSYSEAYSMQNVGGVAGDVMNATLMDKEIMEFKNKSSAIIPNVYRKPAKAGIIKLLSTPVEGMEDYLLYITKAGIITINPRAAKYAQSHPTKSMLAMGANMSVSKKAVEKFRWPSTWIMGLGGEQYLGWYLWKQGYRVIFNPNIKVYHISHGPSLSRNIQQLKKENLLHAEQELLFYRLYAVEKKLSFKHRLLWLMSDFTIDIKRICVNKETYRFYGFKIKIFRELIGLKWLVYQKLKIDYSPLTDLKKTISP